MKSTLFTLLIFTLLLCSCDLINPKSEHSKSFMTFEIDGTNYDSRDWMYEFTNLSANLSTRYEKDVIGIRLRGVIQKPGYSSNFPYSMSFSMRVDYEGSQLTEIPPGLRFADSDTMVIPLTIFESITDVLTQIYRPLEDPNNMMTIRVADTLADRYVIGTLESWMFKERLDKRGAFPDTFKIERGQFFVELEDLRE